MPQATGPDTSDDRTTAYRLAREIGEVESAIELVRSGAASRVTVAGLRFGEQIVAQLRAEAAAVGVRLEPLYWPEDAGCDVTVRRSDVEV